LEEAAEGLGLDPVASLREVALALPDEEQETILGLGKRLKETLNRIDELSKQTKDVLAQHLTVVMDALALLGSTPTAGKPSPHGTTQPVLIDTRA